MDRLMPVPERVLLNLKMRRERTQLKQESFISIPGRDFARLSEAVIPSLAKLYLLKHSKRKMPMLCYWHEDSRHTWVARAVAKRELSSPRLSRKRVLPLRTLDASFSAYCTILARKLSARIKLASLRMLWSLRPQIITEGIMPLHANCMDEAFYRDTSFMATPICQLVTGFPSDGREVCLVYVNTLYRTADELKEWLASRESGDVAEAQVRHAIDRILNLIGNNGGWS
jgi:hypothetical protein